jgi:3-deoxy-7-phosphoheptulonate synthase
MNRDEARAKLDEFRVLIDDVDRRLVALLNERTRVVENIGRVKRSAELPIYEPKREDQVFANVIGANGGPLTQEAVKRIFERIIDEMRTIQRARMVEPDGDQLMLVVMQQGATEQQIQTVIDRLVEMGFDVHRSTGVIHTVLGGVGGKDDFDLAIFEVMEGVKEAHRIVSPYKLASRSFRPGGSVIRIGGVEIGGSRVVVMAGPCSVESREQINLSAEAVARAGATVIRGGAFKPRSSPYSFQGMGEEGLKLLRKAADKNGLLVVSEVMDQTQIPMVGQYSDILQVGARNMQNFNLLRELGRIRKPVLLKRGISATIEELLLSAEYILAGGNYDVILCERGIRTFETYTRNTMDISAIPVVKKLSHLPMIADPSHGTGRRDKVAAMARASVAAGADGLLIEVHPDPDRALSDGAQSLRPDQFEELMGQLRMIAPAVGRGI